MKQIQSHSVPQAIPQFALYGEDPWLDDPSFIHCEDIASRSSALGWKINAHRHEQMFQCLVIESGHTVATLDEQQVALAESCAIWIPPGVVHSFQFAPHTEGCVISCSERMLLGAEDSILRDSLDQRLTRPYAMGLNQQSSGYENLIHITQLLRRELQRSELGKIVYCDALLRQLLVELSRMDRGDNAPGHVPENDVLLQAFKRTLDQHYRDHWSIAEYAKALKITPSRLTRLIRKHTGIGAKEMIQRRIIMESKRKLIYTRQTADEIAFELGFKDPAYFSRFFKKFTGSSPGIFRAENRF